MKTYTPRPVALPLDDTWDVIVVGGGPAGCTAAAAAAREGAKTLLVEASGMLGGAGTGALVPAWCPFSDQEKIIYRGLAETVFNRCKEGQPHVKSDALDWVAIDPERLKRVYDDLVTGAGAAIRFHTALASVERDENGEVSTIIVANKAGLSALRAKVFVDCSGDADLCAWAGAEFHKGDASGKMMPATHCFVLTNVDEYAYRHICFNLAAEWPDSPIYKILTSGEYPLIPDSHICNKLIGPGTVGFNAGHIWEIDNTDPDSVSRALVLGRKMAAQFRDALAKFCPEAFANAFLIMTGSVVGIRETRRITGDYAITLDDYLQRRSFEDEICRNSYFIDTHLAREESPKDSAAMGQLLSSTIRYQKGESHGIPYRSLIPRGLRNVLVAGRSISCDRVVQGSVRVMPVCLAMGEAAGMAAAHAALNHAGDVRAIPVSRLRDRLKEEGGYLPE
jgi:glycine/D-amino acid oxidase-like deaminating enzyme